MENHLLKVLRAFFEHTYDIIDEFLISLSFLNNLGMFAAQFLYRNLNMSFSFIDTAFAQAATAPAQPSTVEMLILPMGLMLVMYFLLIRPNAKKAKEHRELMANLKTGDEVITTGGIIGRVKSIADGFITLESGSSNFKILKEHVSALSTPKAVTAKQTATENAAAKK